MKSNSKVRVAVEVEEEEKKSKNVLVRSKWPTPSAPSQHGLFLGEAQPGRVALPV